MSETAWCTKDGASGPTGQSGPATPGTTRQMPALVQSISTIPRLVETTAGITPRKIRRQTILRSPSTGLILMARREEKTQERRTTAADPNATSAMSAQFKVAGSWLII